MLLSIAMLRNRWPYEQEVFRYLETTDFDYDVIFDIGANIGIHSLFFSSLIEKNKKQKSCNIISFEPSGVTFLELIRNLSANKIKNVFSFNCAIYSKGGLFDFYEPEGFPDQSSLTHQHVVRLNRPVHTNKVLAISGDCLESFVVDAEKILIKVDVEGSEYEVLKSIENLILKKRPTLIIEALPLYVDKLNHLEFLHQANYQFYEITDKGLELHTRFEVSQYRNYILVPT